MAESFGFIPMYLIDEDRDPEIALPEIRKSQVLDLYYRALNSFEKSQILSELPDKDRERVARWEDLEHIFTDEDVHTALRYFTNKDDWEKTYEGEI